ncbi:hypothetical protein V6259_00370 [Marinomonas sp. TI.3.20]|uniref:hypothetical protein n=1 Tax=Marinomonas sp. TI.3.20 TaxID=3121296 RepID=UPI00311F1FF7
MEQLEVRKTLINAIENDSLLGILSDFEFKAVRAEESVIIKELISLHNESRFDLNEQFRQLDDRNNPYDLMYIYCAALPELTCSVVDVIDVFQHVKENKLPDANFHEFYVQFCKQDIERPKVALSYLLDKPEERNELIQTTLFSAAELDSKWVMAQFSDLIQHPNPSVRRQIYLAIGRMPLVDGCSAEERFELLDKAYYSENNSMAKSGIVRAVGFLAKNTPDLWLGVNQILDSCLGAKEAETIHEAAYLLCFECKSAPDSTVDLLISYVKHTSPKNQDTFNLITIVIRNAINAEKYDVAENLLKSLLLKNEGVTIDFFSHLAHEISNKENNTFLNLIVTKWFLSGEVKLYEAIHDLVSSTGLSGNELSIDKSVLPLTDKKILFLSKKVISWFYLQPISAISYLFSIFPHASSNIKIQIEQLIYDPLLLSYMGKSKRYIQDKLESIDDENIRISIHRLLSNLDSYCSDISEANSVKELLSPQREADLYWKDFNTKLSQSIDHSKKGSIMELVGTQTILYGRDVIGHIHTGHETKRSINTMQTFSQSTEMPKMDIIDPEGLNIMLRVFRTERFNNEVDS